MDVVVEVFTDRLEFSGAGRRVTVALIESSGPGPLWMTDFRMAADLIRKGLLKLGASGFQPWVPPLTIVLNGRVGAVSDLERRALESAALIAGARQVTVKP